MVPFPQSNPYSQVSADSELIKPRSGTGSCLEAPDESATMTTMIEPITSEIIRPKISDVVFIASDLLSRHFFLSQFLSLQWTPYFDQQVM